MIILRVSLLLLGFVTLIDLPALPGPRRCSASDVPTRPKSGLDGSPNAQTSRNRALWSWDWKPAPEETSPPSVEICPLLYDKLWAYTVEVDDGPSSTRTVAQPLLARFHFTDAPPGLPGGTSLPFVGGAAVIVQRVGTSNHAYLSWEQLRELEHLGWGVLNHSYWHTGNHWDPAQRLAPADFRRELFWSQALLASLSPSARRDIHFVYPSGDYNYAPYLAEFGIHSASRVSGKCRSLTADATAFLDLDRNCLDEGVWSTVGDPMYGFPKDGPEKNSLVIDFTHNIESAQNSPNQRRWMQRLSTIATQFGKEGADTLWCAPTTSVIAYTLAARSAKAEVQTGRLVIDLPESSPCSRLTVKLTGLSKSSQLQAPQGGLLFRKGDEAWITTPALVRAKPSPSKPPLRLVYEGPIKNVTLTHSEAIAAVRLLQAGKAAPLRIDLVKPDGRSEPLLSSEQARVPEQWGCWLLFGTITDRPAVTAKEVRVAPDPALERMEIWALASE